VISETDVTFSSQSKGEILADTIRIVSGYADIIAIRSKTTGDAKLASEYSSVPIINA
jgi:aspartate carbamoyltransferase catalytic subunit